ncbi:hypothetical protein GJAV_G00273960 [Gymnothorax javanicus]|nr:hypothetical protein GJAV_G00273960 [Gymnothorax javanicus]
MPRETMMLLGEDQEADGQRGLSVMAERGGIYDGKEIQWTLLLTRLLTGGVVMEEIPTATGHGHLIQNISVKAIN